MATTTTVASNFPYQAALPYNAAVEAPSKEKNPSRSSENNIDKSLATIESEPEHQTIFVSVNNQSFA
jgi:hypothetical protein